MCTIELNGISKSFGGLQAVRDVSFTVEKGGITGLIGPNGAGKTTVFNMIAGTFAPDTGSIRLDGEDITGLPTHRLFHKGLVRTFQIPHEFSRMSVRENLMLVPAKQSGERLLENWLRWWRVIKEDREILKKADEVLDFLEIGHVRNELAGNLSGGQKKLLDLGRTMMTDARAVLLDEPGAGVNRTLLGKLTQAIQRLNKEHGYTFCVIEHDMDLIARLCDPVIVMANGEILASGDINSVRDNPDVREAYLGSSAA
ncbi:MAG: ABC transporter ATP-binding protein [Gammaproteobacteria bacterium]|nr:ABC transporter ATP-binding protein [Gammaproteobacteria bacterium]